MDAGSSGVTVESLSSVHRCNPSHLDPISLVLQVLSALQTHSGHAGIVEHGLRCLWGLSSHADNKGPLLACAPTVLQALTMHGDSVGVCQASLACLRSLANRPDNRASLCTALQQVRVRVSSGLEFSSMMRRPWGCDSSCSKPCSLDMRHGREGGAAHGSCSACA